jgi:hypothetical protein
MPIELSVAVPNALCHARRLGEVVEDAHAEDEEWHPCMLPRGDEGGES